MFGCEIDEEESVEARASQTPDSIPEQTRQHTPEQLQAVYK